MVVFAAGFRTYSLRSVRAKSCSKHHHSTQPIAPLRDRTYAASPQLSLGHAAACVKNSSTFKRYCISLRPPAHPDLNPQPSGHAPRPANHTRKRQERT